MPYRIRYDPIHAHILGTPGEYAWRGAASMAFWVDPHEELMVISLMQLMPSSSYPLRRELRALTCAALIDSCRSL
jgi:CubicO group peptidase (beta-lactamase class C family)